MIQSRADVTALIRATKLRKKLTWKWVAEQLGQSKEWTTAACLGQMQLSTDQANILGQLFELPDDAIEWLQVVPNRGSEGIPVDPTIYRLHEMLSVYGITIKELIHEEFGDGIMSAIDFKMHIEREQCDAGDRVKIVCSGKFLPYKPF